MGHLEKALDWLRPLILGSNTWDYCVVWKLGNDPSRFIEWVGCCCNGGGNQEIGNKRIKKEKNLSNVCICRDVNFVHPANTKSCEALASLPPYMSLYSGVHGEVVISSQSRWINIASAQDSKQSNEENEGTRVLIPVFGGLVELFSTEQIPENETVIEYVKAQIISSETETISNSTVSFDGPNIDPLLEKPSDTCFSSLLQFNIMPMTQTLNPITKTRDDSAKNGSSTGSFPSDEGPSLDSVPDGRQKTEKNKEYKSKNLYTERRRRKRNNDVLLTLRSLVPNITKMHKAATLSDAVDYVKELKNEVRNLLDELDGFDDCDDNTHDLKDSRMTEETVELKIQKQPKSEVQVGINQLGIRNYLLRIVCQHTTGVFTKLLRALRSMDMLVVDVNSTVCNGTMSSSLIVQANKEGFSEKEMRDSLMLLGL